MMRSRTPRYVVLAMLLLPVTAVAAADAPTLSHYTTDGTESLLVQADHVDKAPFRWTIGGAEFGGIFDSTSYLGYNVNGAGGKVVASEPLFSWNIEQDYNQGGYRKVESYFEFANVDGSQRYRPWFMQLDRQTGFPNVFHFTGETFGFKQIAPPYQDSPPWLEFYPGAIAIRAASGKPAQLQMGTPVGESSLINMTWGGQHALSILAVRPNHVQIRSGGGAAIDLINGDMHVNGPIVLRSPDGAAWALSVSNDGVLTTTAR